MKEGDVIEFVRPFAEWGAAMMEVIGVSIIAALSISALIWGAMRLLRRESPEATYHQMRQRLGRGILLGLEFLVAADIIHTVAVDLSLRTVGVLAVVVLIRTFLSFALEVELNGRWPWQSQS